MEVHDARRVREAAEVLAAAVAEMDLGSMLPAAHRELVALGERIERTGRTVKSLAAAKVAESSAWQGDGDRTPEDWPAHTTGTTRAEAAKELECGRHLQLVPEVARAATAGELSAKQTEAIAGAAAVDPTAAGRLLDSAKDQGLRRLQDEWRATRTKADPDPEATRARIHGKRSYRTWTDPDGTGHLHLSGPSDVIARADNAVRHRCDPLFRDARRDGRREPTDAYAFDAATELLTSGGDSTPVPVGADAKIIVRVDLPALLRGRAVGEETCEIAGLGPIPVAVVRAWMENAFLAAIVTRGTEITEYDHFEDWADTRTPASAPGAGSARPVTDSRPRAGTSPPPTPTASAPSLPGPRTIPLRRSTVGPSSARSPRPRKPRSEPGAVRWPEAEVRVAGPIRPRRAEVQSSS